MTALTFIFFLILLQSAHTVIGNTAPPGNTDRTDMFGIVTVLIVMQLFYVFGTWYPAWKASRVSPASANP